MAGSLLLLLDDIATILDDVAVLSKVAAKKTAGVLGDDLALNAQQVSGVNADRELPVVWAVAKGSFLNKCILVPLALLISFFAPWLINPLLMLGGLFLCYEGVEKVLHSLRHKKSNHEIEAATEKALLETDLASLEKQKIKGAIMTDFILSAEIIVISLGTVVTATFGVKVAVMCIIAVVMTIGVYGFVAMIVKIDDLGLYLLQQASTVKQTIGRGLLAFAPKLMKTLTIVGTIAMFLVGGGIIAHAVPLFHHWTEDSVDYAEHIPSIGNIIGALTPTLINFAIGFAAGLLVLIIVSLGKKIFKKAKTASE